MSRCHTKARSSLFDELRLPVLLAPLADIWQGEQIIDGVKRLKEKDKSGQLLKTLDALFECNGNVTECSKMLFIHRNTLRYRSFVTPPKGIRKQTINNSCVPTC